MKQENNKNNVNAQQRTHPRTSDGSERSRKLMFGFIFLYETEYFGQKEEEKSIG